MTEYSIDRFEGDIAVLCGDEGTLEMKRELLPNGVVEGDIVTLDDGVWRIDESRTEQLRQEIRKLQDKIFE